MHNYDVIQGNVTLKNKGVCNVGHRLACNSMVWAGRAWPGIVQTSNVCGRITARVTRYHDSRVR